MIDKDFTPKGKTSVHLKDMNNILECANSHQYSFTYFKFS